MSSPEARKHLLYALRRVLRPIARLLIRGGIHFKEFADVAQGVYIESAIRDGSEHVPVPARERIAVLAGVTRRRVDFYIDNEGALPKAEPTLAATLVEVLNKWHTSPQYAGPYGIPLELEFDTPAERSFSSLVATVDPKANPSVALEELLRAGAVIQFGEKHFRAVSRYFMMPDPTSPELIEHFGKTLPRLAATLEYNMHPQHLDRRLERVVTADRALPRGLLPEFENYARSRAVDFLLDLDNWLTSQVLGDSDSDDRIPAGVNVFLYVEPPVEEGPLASLVRKS